jgi:predicted RNA binding protein YcfA (HicA-like mRNA interferase family)
MIKRVTAAGWVLKNIEGDHRHYVHATRSGKVTIPGHLGDDLDRGTERSILEQAGLLKKEGR